MGGSKSKSAVESLSKQVTNIASSVTQDCIVNVTQTQSVSMRNTGLQLWGTSSVKQATAVSSKCFQDSNKQNIIQNQIFAAVKNAAAAEGVGVLSAIGGSQAAADTKLASLITNNVTMSNIQNEYNSIMQDQVIDARNSGVQIAHDIDISQGSSVFASAIMQVLEKHEITNALTASVDQQTSAKTSNPLDFIANIVGNVAGAISDSFIAIGAIVICVLGAIIYLVIGGGASVVSDDNETTDEVPEATQEEELPPSTTTRT